LDRKALFDGISSHEYVQRVPVTVGQQMANWPDALFETEELEGRVSALVKKAEVEPVKLRFDERTGRRRQESMTRDDGWGRGVNHTYDVIDVSITFRR
jgi:hypothetical protein